MAVTTLKRAPLEGTTTNTNTETKTFETGKWNGNSGNITIQIAITRASGAAAGTATPQISLDGVKWASVPGQTAATLTDVADQSFAWSLVDRKAIYYRVQLSTTGTGVLNSYVMFLEDEDKA